MRSVNSLLQRPLSHVWDSPQEKVASPEERWNPAISEYIEAKGDVFMGLTACKLMKTKPIDIGTGR